MEEYTVITQGNAIYLEGKLGDEEQLDEVDRGMLVSNQIAGFLPLSVQWVNGNCRLLYNITGLTPLEQAARILENETRLTNFFLSLCKVEKECDEYLLNPRKIDLEPGVVYLGADGKAFVLYRPVEAAGQKYDPMELTHFVFRLIGQQMPRDSRILNVLSRQLLYGGSFSFAELEPKLKEKPVMEKIPEPVQEETPRYEERHPIQAKPYVPPKPVMEPPKPEIPKQEPVVPEPAQDNPFAQSGNPFAEVQPKNEKPQKENKKAEKKPEKKSGGLFGLFGGKKDKKKAGSEEQENPFQQKEEPPQAAQKAEMPRAQRPAPVSAPMQAPAAPKVEAGRTVLLSGSENGGTTKTMVMGSGTTGAGELYLVQKDTNQYIHVTHTNFHTLKKEYPEIEEAYLEFQKAAEANSRLAERIDVNHVTEAQMQEAEALAAQWEALESKYGSYFQIYENEIQKWAGVDWRPQIIETVFLSNPVSRVEKTSDTLYIYVPTGTRYTKAIMDFISYSGKSESIDATDMVMKGKKNNLSQPIYEWDMSSNMIGSFKIEYREDK